VNGVQAGVGNEHIVLTPFVRARRRSFAVTALPCAAIYWGAPVLEPRDESVAVQSLSPTLTRAK
jgi:hypothetical protein